MSASLATLFLPARYLRKEVVSLCDVVQHVVGVDGSSNVTPQDLRHDSIHSYSHVFIS